MSVVAVNDVVYSQFIEEHGPEETPEHKFSHRMTRGNRTFDSGCIGCRETASASALRQKYGLTAVVLTDSDRQLINREERRLVSR